MEKQSTVEKIKKIQSEARKELKTELKTESKPEKNREKIPVNVPLKSFEFSGSRSTDNPSPEIPEEKKRGRPPKEKKRENQEEKKEDKAIPEMFSPDEVKSLSGFLLNTYFERKEWKLLSAREEAKLGEALARVANKRLPAVLAEYMEELQLLIILSGIFFVRLNAERNSIDTREKGMRENDSSKTADRKENESLHSRSESGIPGRFDSGILPGNDSGFIGYPSSFPIDLQISS